jgi:hypothetical protein
MLDNSNTTAAISEAGTAYPVGSFEFTIVFYSNKAVVLFLSMTWSLQIQEV